jgi:hypothetical protein
MFLLLSYFSLARYDAFLLLFTGGASSAAASEIRAAVAAAGFGSLSLKTVDVYVDFFSYEDFF